MYLVAGDEDEKTALLCVLGLREDGEKALLGIGLVYRESEESWAADHWLQSLSARPGREMV